MDEQSYKARRTTYMQRMKKRSVALFFSATQKTRSNDTEFPYRQDSDFYYLTGFKEDNSVLLLVKEKKSTKEILFVQKKDPTLELWTGKRLGKKEAQKRFLVDKIFLTQRLHVTLKKLFRDKKRVYLDLSCEEKNCLHVAFSFAMNELISQKLERLDVRDISRKMRAIKTPQEIALIKKALSITKEAHHKVMAMQKSGKMEYELQAEFEYLFKKNGAYSDAYTTIIAGGNNGNTLHYIQNDQMLQDGQLILIDAGCEYAMYASDITRTIPVNGVFSDTQKEVYELVLQAEMKVIEAMKEGVLRSDLQRMAREILCQGMVRLGILEGDVTTLLNEEKDKKYFPHGIGHWMGLDVHDPCPYKDKKGKELPLKSGMVMTIEPGLYLPLDDASVPQKYRGIAVRIEDNILVTKEGYENLSYAIAKSVEAIEALYSYT